MAKNLKSLLKEANKKAGQAIASQIEAATEALSKAKTGEQVDAAMARIERLGEQAKPYMKTTKRKS